MLRLLLIALWASQALATNILLMLFQEQKKSDNAWQPLYDAMGKHPSVVFECVIIPKYHSKKVDPDLAAELKKIRSYHNGAILGYVDTRTGTGANDEFNRKDSDILADVAQYAAWPADVAPSGIYFGGVDPAKRGNSLKTIAAKTRTSLNGTMSSPASNAARIIFDTSYIPASDDDGAAIFAAADRVIIFQDRYKELQAQESAIAAEEKSQGAKKIGLVIKRTPTDQIDKVTTKYITEMGGVGSLYVTDLPAVYPDFGNSFSEFVNAVAAHAHM